MVKVAAAGVVLLAGPLAALFGLVAMVAGSASAAAGPGQALFSPSEDAVADIPALLLNVYAAQSTACPGLPWQVVAAIGKVESNHGRFGGSSIDPDGVVSPPIIGIALNGTNGTAAIRDTDNGVHDYDPVWDRAVGPFQFIPSSWAIYGQDGNRDGLRDPHNVHDAIPAVVAHLCPYGSVTDLEAAIFSYNHSGEYVQLVLEWASRYTGPLSSFGAVVAGYAYPGPPAHATIAAATRRHHDYPAVDLAMPEGTPAFAMVDGLVSAANGSSGIYVPGGAGRCGNTIVITGIDGAVYTYCHLSAVAVRADDQVQAGQAIGLSGGRPGAPGAGNTTGPHLHLSIRAYGQSVCPQPVLLGILRGTPVPPTAAPSTGCYTPEASIDWGAWLDAVLQRDESLT